MRIEAITLREIRMPLVDFFETSFGRTTERRILLVTVHCEGVDGWGECTAGEHPFYCEESTDTAWYVLREYLAPAFAGRELESGREAAFRMPAVRGHRMAKAALENAVWDAEAQVKQVPLWKLVGGTRKELAAGVSIGIQESHEQLLEKIAVEVAAGISADQGEGEAGVGRGGAGEDSRAVAGDSALLRRQQRVHAG